MKFKSFKNVTILSLALIFCFFVSNNNTVHANAEASPITFGKTYTGAFDDYWADDKVYKITLPEDGKVTLSIKHKTGHSWEGKIVNSDEKEYVHVYTSSESLVSGYAKVIVGLPKGTHYVKIASSGGDYAEPYAFKVDFTADKYYEKEFNDTIKTANSMKLNQTYKGIISDYYDKDVYKIVLPKSGNLNFSIKHKSGHRWWATIVDSKGKEYGDVVTDESALISGHVKTQVGLPKGTYYVQVTYSGGDYKEEYEIKAAFTASNYYEKEFNDTIKTANKIKLNKTYKGVIRDYYDKDIFKFTVPSTGDVTLSIKRKAEAGWNGHIQNSAGTIFNEISNYSDNLASGNDVSTVTLKKGDYYLVMSDYILSEGDQYEVKVSHRSSPLKKSQIKVKNNKGKNDTIAVSKIAKGDTVKVYSKSKGGKLLASKKSTGKKVTLSTKQIGKKSGKVYVTVTKSKMSASKRVAVTYKGEKSNSLKKAQVKVKNNKGKNDSIAVSKIAKGDTIKVYSKTKGGKLLASKKSKGKKLTLTTKQIGKKSGKIYVTVTKSKMSVSNRVAVSYKAER